MNTEYLTTTEVADKLRVSVRTLEKWRRFPGKGPLFHKVGHRVVYAVLDVDQWMEANRKVDTK